MVTLNKIAATILDRLGKPFDHMLNEQLKFEILALRSKFVRQEFERNGTDPNLLQHYVATVEPLTTTDKTCGLYGCNVYKVMDVPAPINIKLGGVPFIEIVAQTNDRPSFQHASLAEIRNADTRKIPNLRYYHFSNKVIYLYGFPVLAKKVLIQGYFEDPAAVLEKCADVNCLSDDEPFDLGAHMVEDIINTIIQKMTQPQLEGKREVEQ